MKIGIATLYYRNFSIVSAVKSLVRVTDVIMLSPIYKKIDETEIKELIEIKNTFGIEYVIHAPIPNPLAKEPRRDGYDMELYKSSFELAQRLESRYVMIHPASRNEYRKEIEKLKELYKLSEEYGFELSVENKPDNESFLKSEEDFRRLIEDVPEIKFCIDTAHFYLWTRDSGRLSNLIKEFRNRISIFHIADAIDGRDLQMVPGYGEIDWFRIGNTITRYGLARVPMILEVVYPAELLQGIKNIRHVLATAFKSKEDNFIG